jgi:hypothetical protein
MSLSIHGHCARQRDLDLASVVVGLTDLGVTVQCGPTVPARNAADWSEDRRTITLRADLPVSSALYVLRDLYDLHVTPGHLSPSTTFPCLRVVS